MKLSPVTNANSHIHRPSSCQLPHYAHYAGSTKLTRFLFLGTDLFFCNFSNTLFDHKSQGKTLYVKQSRLHRVCLKYFSELRKNIGLVINMVLYHQQHQSYIQCRSTDSQIAARICADQALQRSRGGWVNGCTSGSASIFSETRSRVIWSHFGFSHMCR